MFEGRLRSGKMAAGSPSNINDEDSASSGPLSQIGVQILRNCAVGVENGAEAIGKRHDEPTQHHETRLCLASNIFCTKYADSFPL